MLAVAGTYLNGKITLDEEYPSDSPVKVIVTFLEEEQNKPDIKKRLLITNFSFLESQKDLANYKGSLSDVVIEERRAEL